MTMTLVLPQQQALRYLVHSSQGLLLSRLAPRIIGTSAWHCFPFRRFATTKLTTATRATNNQRLSTCRFYSSQSEQLKQRNTKVCIVGSGNWGSAVAKIIGTNCQTLDFCDRQVNMWVHDEMVPVVDNNNNKTSSTNFAPQEDTLSHVINQRHENVKYLAGISLPENVVAVPDLAQACHEATLLVFVVPHQFLPALLPTLKDSVDPQARGVSLIKGLGKWPKESLLARNTTGAHFPHLLILAFCYPLLY